MRSNKILYDTFTMSRHEGLRWLKTGEGDYDIAQSLFSLKHYHAVAFHTQQAVEKALKALLIGLGYAPWGHRCVGLLADIQKALPNAKITAELKTGVRQLDQHYIPSRYPDAFPTGIPEDHFTKK